MRLVRSFLLVVVMLYFKLLLVDVFFFVIEREILKVKNDIVEDDKNCN